MKSTQLLPALLLLGLNAPTTAQDEMLPKVALQNFTGTKARSLNDFRGRLLLVEYFAYW